MPEKTERATIFKLKPTRLHIDIEGNRTRQWFAEIEEGTPYEALFTPIFWDIHAYKFAMNDTILCIPDESHYRAVLEVVGIGVGGTKVEELTKKDRTRAAVPEKLSSQYEIKYGGAHHKWRVMRIADKHIEQGGFANEGDASRWLADNLKALSKSLPKPKDEAA